MTRIWVKEMCAGAEIDLQQFKILDEDVARQQDVITFLGLPRNIPKRLCPSVPFSGYLWNFFAFFGVAFSMFTHFAWSAVPIA